MDNGYQTFRTRTKKDLKEIAQVSQLYKLDPLHPGDLIVEMKDHRRRVWIVKEIPEDNSRGAIVCYLILMVLEGDITMLAVEEFGYLPWIDEQRSLKWACSVINSECSSLELGGKPVNEIHWIVDSKNLPLQLVLSSNGFLGEEEENLELITFRKVVNPH